METGTTMPYTSVPLFLIDSHDLWRGRIKGDRKCALAAR